MKKRFIVLAILAGGFLAAVPNIPLGWVAPHVMPETAGQDIHYSGTIWDGQIRGLDFIGTMNFEVSAKELLSGLPLTFQTQSPIIQMSGRASRNRLQDYRFFSDRFSDLPTRDGRLKELNGQISIMISELEYDGSCVAATGRMSTDFLTRNEGRWQWRGPNLSGPISCENGDLVVRLTGSENRQRVNADLYVSQDGTYRADIKVQTDQAEAGVVLPLYGFEPQGPEFKLTEQGRWR